MSNKPKLRFKEFNDSIVECRIENVLKIKHGKDQKAIECKDGIYPILATSGEIGRTNTYLWNKPCVLIGRKGTINKPQYMDTPFWTVDTLFYSDVNSSNNAKYLYYLFNTINWKRYDESTGVPSLSAKTVERIKVIITNNKDEQKKIAEFLSKVDEVIAEREEEVKDLKKQKKGLMQKIFSQELRFTDSNNNPYPNWEEKKIKDIGYISMCKRIFREQTSSKGDIPFYKIGTFGKEPDAFISRELFQEYKEKYPYPKTGNILISASGTIGRTVEYNGEDAYYQDSNIIWINHNDLIMDKFLNVIIQNTNWDKVIEGSTIKRLYNNNLLELKISLPCLEEQQKISNVLSKLDELIEEKKALLSDWQSFKKGLLQQMFV